jgi:collagenase-like PrtC family protease
MANYQFSLPYNNDLETLHQLFALQGHHGNSIYEIYLSGPQEHSGSGRITSRVNLSDLIKTIELIHENRIRVNLTLNTVCQGAGWYSSDTVNSTVDFLRKMHREHGVEAVTVANPIYIREIKQRLPDLEVCASVLSDVDCVQRALIAKQAGADTITPDANINRNLGLLKEIKEATDVKLKIMVNEGCLYKCLFRKFHFNYVSHCSKEIGTPVSEMKDFFTYCLAITSKDYSQILKSGWVRPEDLSSYADITCHFKIVGRTRPMSMVLRTVKAYMEQHYSGNIFDLLCSSLQAFSMTYGAYLNNTDLEDSGFFKKVSACNQQCDTCHFCQDLAHKLVKLKVVTREKLEDLGHKELAYKLEEEGKLPHFG